MQRLVEVARQRGVKQLVGAVLRENRRMLALAKELGFSEPTVVDHDVLQVVLEL
jgi:L-amino acid N-acyltransferase YncA